MICKHFDLPFESIEEAEREIVGEKGSGLSGGSGNTVGRFTDSRNESGMVNITAPATSLAKIWDGWGTALKPSWEPIIVAMKPLDGTYAENAEKWGVAGLWIDGGRIGTEIIPGQSRGNARNVSFQSGGFTPEHQGRFPSNTILSCTCEDEHEPDCPVRMLDEQSGVLKTGGCPRGTHESTGMYGAGKNIPVGQPSFKGDSGGASRFFYTAKASKSERNAGCGEIEEQERVRQGLAGEKKNTFSQNFHPTVKPLALMEYLCKLTKTPTGGIVLDPFAGSGTTGLACLNTQRKFILIEKKLKHIKITKARIRGRKRKRRLFDE